jgi:hypothetical protein
VPIVPFAHNHRRHAITHYGHTDDFRVESIQPAPDDDRPVTVADLLDWVTVNRRADSDWYDVYDRASSEVAASYHRIRFAVGDHAHLQESLAALSPEERAEFDRRTT